MPISPVLSPAQAARTYTPAFGVYGNITDVSYDRVYALAQAPGGTAGTDVDLYTVASGKRALIQLEVFNNNLSALSYFTELKLSGVYYRLITSASVPSLNQGSTAVAMIFEAGDTLSMNLTGASLTLTQVTVVSTTVTYTGTITGGGSNAFAGKQFVIQGFANSGNNITFTVTGSSITTLVGTTSTQVNETHAGTAIEQTGMTIMGSVVLFDNTVALKTVRVLSSSFTNGDNTIYTCPSGKQALIAGYSPLLGNSGSASQFYVNQSGSAATIHGNIVKSGQSPSASNIILNNNNATVANNTIVNGTMTFQLQAGDYYSLNTNQTGKQNIWLNILEMAA